MSKQNKSTQVGNRIILNGTALLLLAYMLASSCLGAALSSSCGILFCC